MTLGPDFGEILVADTPAEPPAPAAPASTDWRDDPLWRLTYWNEDLLSARPSDRPDALAELAQPDLWASLYDGREQVAVWSREPLDRSVRPPV